ncbi:hypothetical protein [Enterococcus sp. AZ196]|uniref:hypothetical protein n=1 Tax=Enterococcus sp. AZ196 TaxID=2774659 RepID=UPI003D28C305
MFQRRIHQTSNQIFPISNRLYSRSFIHPSQVLILESTSYPGTTGDYLIQPLEQEEGTIGKDLFIAFSPEREAPGNSTFEVRNTVKLVGGAAQKCTTLVQSVIGEQAVPVRSIEIAELAKVYENSFRFININLANDLHSICYPLGIDPYYLKWCANQMNVEVPLIDAASQMEARTMDRLVQEALRLLSRCSVPLSRCLRWTIKKHRRHTEVCSI